MTTFEALALLALVATMSMFTLHSNIVINKLKDIHCRQSDINSKLESILDSCNHLQDAWACDVTTIIEWMEANNEQLQEIHKRTTAIKQAVKEIENHINPAFEWGKLTQEQQSEFLYRLTHPIVESPFKPPFNPTCETKSVLDKNEVKQDNSNKV